MNLSAPIHRPSLHEELVDRLREMIVEDHFQPGEKIPEKSLCDSFGVSRTPLREALKVLASEGLVVLTPNRGSRVATVTPEELANTFPVLAALERLVGELGQRDRPYPRAARGHGPLSQGARPLGLFHGEPGHPFGHPAIRRQSGARAAPHRAGLARAPGAVHGQYL